MTFEPVVRYTTCVTVDTDMGYEVIPFSAITSSSFKSTELAIAIRESSFCAETVVSLREHMRPYLEGDPDMTTVRISEGWLAYLTMPGYLDRTDYTLHDSYEDAWEYLCETYGGDEE